MLGRSIADAWPSHRPDDELISLSRADVDLSDLAATRHVFASVEPDLIIHAAAKVGGIADKLAHPTRYLLENLLIDSSVISSAIDLGVRQLIYISSGAIYPENAQQPIVEEAQLTGTLESANESYALAKIAAGRVCAYASQEYGYAYRVVAPSNLYGVHDSFVLGSAHLVAAAIAKAHEAKVSGADTISVWGDGKARREFTFAGDVAEWIVANLESMHDWPPLLNLGAGDDHSIQEYYESVARVIGFAGRLDYDPTRPSGVPRRLLDSSAARDLGWNPQTTLEDGIAATYSHYLTPTQHGENR